MNIKLRIILVIEIIILFIIFSNIRSVNGYIPISENKFESDEIYHFQNIEGYLEEGVITIDEASPSNIYSWGNGTMECYFQEDVDVNGSVMDAYVVKSTNVVKNEWGKNQNNSVSDYTDKTIFTRITYFRKGDFQPIFSEDKVKYLEGDASPMTFISDYKKYEGPLQMDDFLKEEGDISESNIRYMAKGDLEERWYETNFNITFKVLDYIDDYIVKAGDFDVVKIEKNTTVDSEQGSREILFIDVEKGIIVKRYSMNEDSTHIEELTSIEKIEDDPSIASINILPTLLTVAGIAIVWQAHNKKR